MHPLGKSPVITDGEATVAESGAIIEYLIERHGNGRLRPAAGTPELLRYRYWLHFAEGSAMSPLLMKLVFDKVASSPMPFFVKPIARGISAQGAEELRDAQHRAPARLHGEPSWRSVPGSPAASSAPPTSR